MSKFCEESNYFSEINTVFCEQFKREERKNYFVPIKSNKSNSSNVWMMSYPFCICLFGSLLNEYLGGCGEPFAPHVKTEPLSVGVLSTIDEFQESSRRRGEIKRSWSRIWDQVCFLAFSKNRGGFHLWHAVVTERKRNAKISLKIRQNATFTIEALTEIISREIFNL